MFGVQALTLGREVAEAYADAITLLCGLEEGPMDPAALIGLDAAGLYRLSKVNTSCWVSSIVVPRLSVSLDDVIEIQCTGYVQQNIKSLTRGKSMCVRDVGSS